MFIIEWCMCTTVTCQVTVVGHCIMRRRDRAMGRRIASFTIKNYGYTVGRLNYVETTDERHYTIIEGSVMELAHRVCDYSNKM